MNTFLRKKLVVRPKNYIRFCEFFRKIGRNKWFNIKVDDVTRTKFRIDRKSLMDENLLINREAFPRHILRNGYIEDQSRYTDMRYGTQTVQYSGCEVIAVFNVLRSFGRNPDMAALIRSFEEDGCIFGAEFGTSPKSAVDFFTRNGFEAEATYKEEDFAAIAERAGAMILTAYNDCLDIMKMAHTICITKEADGYRPHNSVQSKSYKNIIDLVREIDGGQRGKGIFLVGIKELEETV